jgi:transposase
MYITKKQIKGHTYYYAVMSQRINGKPRTIWQKYLGKVEDIVKRVDAPTVLPYEAVIFEFGAIASLWSIAQRLQVVDTIDAFSPKRRQGGTVGQYMLIAAINRAVAPKSKSRIGEWFDDTVLRRFLPNLSGSDLSSQRFWDHMERLDEESIRMIERELTSHLIHEFNLDLRAVVYDTTNFLTYLDSSNPSELAQRGNSKEKRRDLRVVGLALLVTMDHHIPLFHDVYAGNMHDSKEFASITDELVERYRALSDQCEHVTIIYDKGNNAADNQVAIDESPYHCVGSLIPTQHSDLLDLPLTSFRELDGELAGHRVYRTRKQVLGADRTVLVVYNEALFLGQMQGEMMKLKKAVQALRELSQQLDRRRQGVVTKGKQPTFESVSTRVRQILGSDLVSEIIHHDLTEKGELPHLTFCTDHDALHRIAQQRFGKTLLFTSNSNWTDEDIIRAYRGQFMVENAFAQMKDPHAVAWHPMFHWTDSKIRVHAFYCVLALTLTSLLRREVLHRAAEENIQLTETSIDNILDTLAGIKQVVNIYPSDSGIKPQVTPSRMTAAQKQLFDLLELHKLTSPSVLQT